MIRKWFDKQKKKELLKLLFQANNFFVVHTEVYPNDIKSKNEFNKVKELSDKYFISGNLGESDLQYLLELNSFMRKFYKDNDPIVKMYKTGMTTKRPKAFDEEYATIMGWKEYYREYL